MKALPSEIQKSGSPPCDSYDEEIQEEEESQDMGEEEGEHEEINKK